MNRRDAIKHFAAASAALALPAWAQNTGHRARPVGRLHRPGRAARHPDEQGREAVRSTASTRAGGVNGHHIDLRTLDDGYEPDRCKANTDKLIKDDVFALFGYVGTPTCVAALPLVSDSKIPFFGPFTGAEALRDPFIRNVFHLRASYYDETGLIVQAAHLARAEEDRGLLPERLVRQGRASKA